MTTTPKSRKIRPVPFSKALREEERTLLLVVPIKTYGTEAQLDAAAHRAIRQLSVFMHQDIGGILPDGRKITYDSKGNLVSIEDD